MSDSHPLIRAWREFHPRDRINVLPGDEALLKPHKGKLLFHKCSSFRDYIRDPDFAAQDERQFHLGLIPIPYLGNLATARIFILMLNPGFGEMDYFAEDQSPAFRSSLMDSLQQRIKPNDFPMLSLNPRFSWHGGYQYWSSKLHQVIRAIRDNRQCTWTDALRELSRETACIELYPYHSRSFGLPAVVARSLRSSKLAKDYVHDVLIPKARRGDATIIVTRKSRDWELPHHKNIVVYSPSESRAAHLTLGSKGGRKIAEYLGLVPT